jgi:hypothetical protein
VTDPLTLTASVSRKVNLGNYESQDVFLSVSGITQETTKQEITSLVEGAGEVAYGVIREAVERRITALRQPTNGVVGNVPKGRDDAQTLTPQNQEVALPGGSTAPRYTPAAVVSRMKERKKPGLVMETPQRREARRFIAMCRTATRSAHVVEALALSVEVVVGAQQENAAACGLILSAILGRLASSPPTVEELTEGTDRLYQLEVQGLMKAREGK